MLNEIKSRGISGKRLYFLLIVLVVVLLNSVGCGGRYITQRLDCYKAMSLNPSEMEKYDGDYVVISFIQNAILTEGEQGSSWLVLLKNKTGSIEKYFATRKDNKVLMAIVPISIERLKGSKFVLLSHDGGYCYNPHGQEFNCSNGIDWENATEVKDKKDGVIAVESGDSLDQKIRQIYKIVIEKNPALEKDNSTLSPKTFKALKNAKTVKTATGITKDTLTLGLPLIGFLAGVLPGIITTSTGVIYYTIQKTTEKDDLNFPEYYAGNNTNRASAVGNLKQEYKFVQFQQKIQNETKNPETPKNLEPSEEETHLLHVQK